MAFVDHYLIPYKLKNKSHRFIGAFVMDMLLTFDTNNDTQFVPLDIVDASIFHNRLITSSTNRA